MDMISLVFLFILLSTVDFERFMVIQTQKWIFLINYGSIIHYVIVIWVYVLSMESVTNLLQQVLTLLLPTIELIIVEPSILCIA